MPKPQRSLRVQNPDAGVVSDVAFGQFHAIWVDPRFVPLMMFVRMQGTKRAPMLIKTNGEGPIMGLKEGWISMGEPVRAAGDVLVKMKGEGRWDVFTIADELDDQDDGLHEGEEEAGPGNGTAEPAPPTILRRSSAMTERISWRVAAVLELWVCRKGGEVCARLLLL